MRVQRMSAPLGAIIDGVDVRRLGEAEFADIRALFQEHQVLALRGQTLTPQEQLAFGQRWGELVRHPYAGMKAYPDLIELKNPGKARDINQHWHSDMTYNRAPPKLTMLYALETPGIGGDTAFANQALAYAELSEGLRRVVDGLRAVHSAEGLAGQYGADPGQAPRAEHPVVRTHDETGQRALYVCRAFTRRFVGWTREESAGLLEYLFQHGARPEFQARHSWRPGDLVLWDNRCLLHFAVHDHGDAPRRIHRLQVAGPAPA
ncbi:MAG: TauD/TfdA family dioxygenase [Pseudomonadales bacterium]|nr:TauD/TfdA family dioxygenase [Pseudomonadales bacterium]